MNYEAVDLKQLAGQFHDQFNGVYRDIGGFFNPTIEHEDESEICFRCFYNNYDNDDDIWHWYYDKIRQKFHN